tara:strand:- start:2013 stop:4163 length:2151 start_codon:yes stop_codon:yes gene_type:complete
MAELTEKVEEKEDKPATGESASLLSPTPLSGKMNQINYGGAVVEFPVEWDDNQVGSHLKRFRESPEFYDLVDMKTGVDLGVSTAVGAARSREDKLATLKKFHPDALPFDEDNFVFTHHETGRPTLYNPPGFDSGDVARHGRDIAVAGGATLGSIFGAGGGFVLGAPTGPGAAITTTEGAIYGASLGAASTATFYDFLTQAFMGTEDTRRTGERFVDTTVEAVTAGAGEKIGRVIGPKIEKGIKNMLGGGTKRSKQIYDALMELEITPTAGVVTGGKGAGRIEGALDQAAPSATIMREAIEKVIKETEEAAAKTAEKIGTPGSQQKTGEIIQKGSAGAIESYKKSQKILEDKLSEVIGPDRIIPIKALRELREGFEAKVLRAPNSLGPKYKGTIAQIKSIEADAEAFGGLPYSIFREHRTTLGKKMADFNEKATEKSLYKRMYGNMSKDLEDVIDTYGPEIKDQFKETMNFTKRWNDEHRDLFEKLVDMDAPEKAFRYMMNTRKDGGTILRKLESQFTKSEWDDISSTVVKKMGYKNFGNEADDAFSVSTFLSNYKSLANEAKDVMFQGESSALRKELDNLVKVFQSIQDNARLGNFSNTAGAIHALDTLTAMGINTTDLAASIAMGQPTIGAAKGLIGNTVGRLLFPRQIAKLMTNPSFVKWLATPPVKGKKAVASHIGRLAAVAKASPWIREDLKTYLESLSRSDEPEVSLQGVN